MAAVRRAIQVRRVGHTGTLDPFASGLLVVLVGRATRLAQFLVGLNKRYGGVIRLGVTTDSADRTGAVTGTSDAWAGLTADAIRQAMTRLTGKQRQRPPAHSAKRVGGQRAYQLARRGRPVDLAAQDVEIFSFTPGPQDGSDVSFEVTVSSGTYIRSLARDLGEALGCGAHLAELRRTAVGPFQVSDAVPLHTIGPGAVRPARDAVAHLQAVTVGTEERESIRHGRAIAATAPASGPVALLAGGELIAVADANGSSLHPRVVLAE